MLYYIWSIPIVPSAVWNTGPFPMVLLLKFKSWICYLVWTLTGISWNFTEENAAEYTCRLGNMQMENSIGDWKKYRGSLTIT